MVKVKLEILLDNEFAIYYAEQALGGTLKLTIDEEMKVAAINMKLYSHAKVMWTEGGGQHTRVYYATQIYLDESMCLLKQEKGGKDIILNAGTHEYPFKFQLPKNIPSSFEGDIGRVRYEIKGHVNRPWAIDSRCKRVFTFLNPVDLNKIPGAQQAFGVEKEKHFCCCCCKTDPLRATMVVKKRSGYVPGETIHFSSEITNKSSRNIKKSIGKLTMDVTYHATGKSRTISNVLTMSEQGPIKPGGSDTWANGTLHIPSVPPSFLEHCKLIDIHYYAKMQVVPAGCAISLKVPSEVIIGSIPLKEVAEQYNMDYSKVPVPMEAPKGIYSNANTIPSNVPQASFAESVFGRKNVRDDGGGDLHGDKDYAPVYTYYSWERGDPFSNFTVKG